MNESLIRQHDTDNLILDRTMWDKYLWHDYSDQMQMETDPIIQEATERNPFAASFLGETFSRLYNNDDCQRIEHVTPEHQWAVTAHDEAQDIPEWQTLKQQVSGDQFLSGMAAFELGNSVLQAVPEQPQNHKDAKQLRENVDGFEKLLKEMVDGGADADAQAEISDMLADMQSRVEGIGQSIVTTPQTDPTAIRQAIRRAAQEASDKVQEYQDACETFGCGSENGDSNGKGGSAAAKAKLAKALKESTKIQEIAKLAGRMKNQIANKQSTKSDYARTEIVGLEQGDAAHRAIPQELANLSDPDLEPIFFQRMAERSLTQYRLTGKDKQSEGPFIIAIDVSGSMKGQREIWSKALSLGILWLAQKTKRPFIAYQFNKGITETFKSNGSADTSDLLQFMEAFASGGTRIEPVLNQAVKDMESVSGGDTFSKADVIIVSDAEVECDTQAKETYKRAAERMGFNTYAILIGSDDYRGTMKEIGATVTTMDTLLTGERAVIDALAATV